MEQLAGREPPYEAAERRAAGAAALAKAADAALADCDAHLAAAPPALLHEFQVRSRCPCRNRRQRSPCHGPAGTA